MCLPKNKKKKEAEERGKKKQIIHIFLLSFFSSLTLKAEGKIGQVGIPDRKANLFNIK